MTTVNLVNNDPQNEIDCQEVWQAGCGNCNELEENCNCAEIVPASIVAVVCPRCPEHIPLVRFNEHISECDYTDLDF